MKWKRKRFSKPLNIYISFLEEDVTVTMDVIDIAYVGFHHKHEELVIIEAELSLARSPRQRSTMCK